MNPIKRLIRRLYAHRKGSITVEMALSVPVMLICLSGIVEFGYFLLLVLKVQHTAVAVADLVTRDDQISEATLSDIFTAVPRIMAPYDDPTTTRTVVTAINRDPGDDARIAWQRMSGGYTTAQSSYTEGSVVSNLPAEIALEEDETVITTEVFYAYQPLVFRMIPSQELRRQAFFRPRLGSLEEID